MANQKHLKVIKSISSRLFEETVTSVTHWNGEFDIAEINMSLNDCFKMNSNVVFKWTKLNKDGTLIDFQKEMYGNVWSCGKSEIELIFSL